MPDWLSPALSSKSQATAKALTGRIGAALLLGLAVAALKRRARRGESVQATFVTTRVLLAALIATATQASAESRPSAAPAIRDINPLGDRI